MRGVAWSCCPSWRASSSCWWRRLLLGQSTGSVPVRTGRETQGNDTFDGTAANDVIAGLGGDDILNGGGGNDVICGGTGNDTIDGGAAQDTHLG